MTNSYNILAYQTGIIRFDVLLYVCADAVKSIEIVPPDQIFNDQVPTTISLLFGVTVTSQYETDLLDIRDYQWDFGDGSSPSPSDLPSNTHTYSSTGTYTVTASVHAPFVIGSGDASLSLIVYEGEQRKYSAWTQFPDAVS